MVGVLLLLVVYPVVLIVGFIFRRAGPRVKRMSRAVLSRQKQQQEQMERVGVDGDATMDLNNCDTNHTLHIKPRPLVLPWWCRILAWVLVIGVVVGSIFLVWAYALQFGGEKTSRWLSSFIVTFFISILVVEPLMVVLGAVVVAYCCRRSNATRVDADDVDFDEVLPDLELDEEWQHMGEGDVGGGEGRAAYLAFLTVLWVITYSNRDTSAYYMVQHFRNSFVKERDLIWDYKNKVKTTNDYWRWVQKVMMEELRAQRWYNGKPQYGLRGFLGDKQNRIMGYAILRQIRNRVDVCRTPSDMRMEVKKCSGTRGESLEDNTDYCTRWLKYPFSGGACEVPEFKYRTADDLQAYPLVGQLGSYTGGGYVLELRNAAVFLEFSVYNANVNLFGTATVGAEFHPGGGLRPFWRFDSTRLITGNTASDYFLWLNELAFVVATIYFTLREFWKCYKDGPREYLSSNWNLTEIVILFLSYAAIALYIVRSQEVSRVLKVFKETLGNGYVRMELACILDGYYLCISAGVIFFSILKIIKLLQFNNRMNLLGLTFARCWDDLQVFFLTFAIIFFAFTTLFFTIFTLQLEEFSNYLASIQMCFSMMLGKFEFRAMAQANALSPVIFFVFSISTSMILVNLMLTIIIRTFSEVKNELLNVNNKYDIIDYITNKTLLLMGLRSSKHLPMKSQPKVTLPSSATNGNPKSDPNDELPDKVHDLLSYINNMYFDGQLNLNDPGTRKSIMMGKSGSDKLYWKTPSMTQGRHDNTDGRDGKHHAEIFQE
ncbi:hypothetical protein Pmani_007294 [Petrolisthes manimaculis]|uniref:Polycystic kidney disease protein 1-like 2 n=1 Tax=Petrolisthes manimaculis TaxID=1843537 RepID=A0AAE1Q990_9EUCA|nr:hypothetical protein Pmani_007294 [Petrolisthes manimaculis]